MTQNQMTEISAMCDIKRYREMGRVRIVTVVAAWNGATREKLKGGAIGRWDVGQI